MVTWADLKEDRGIGGCKEEGALVESTEGGLRHRSVPEGVVSWREGVLDGKDMEGEGRA